MGGAECGNVALREVVPAVNAGRGETSAGQAGREGGGAGRFVPGRAGRPRSPRGFSLLELVLAMLVFSLVIGAVFITARTSLALTCVRAEDRHTEQVLDRLALDFDKRTGAHALAYGASLQNREIDYGAIDYRWNNKGELDTATVDPGQVPPGILKLALLRVSRRIEGAAPRLVGPAADADAH